MANQTRHYSKWPPVRWLAAIAILTLLFLFRDYLPQTREDSAGRATADAAGDTLGPAEKAGPARDAEPPERSSAGGPYTKPDPSRDTDLPSSDRDAPPPGQLRSIGRNVYESAAGLRYGPGSREGHRLDHVMLHTDDEPNRPGSHGVFAGGKEETLRVIDEAYQIAQQRGPPTRIETDGDRTIYTVDMGRTVGFIGGQTGKRTGRPSVSHVRLVLEGNRIITAFPVKP